MTSARILVAVIAVLGWSSAGAQQTIPSSLTNAQFREIFTTFSESGGNFGADNFTSNENTIGQLASELIVRNKTGGAYVGVGPEQNFTYIAALKPQIVFLVDIRRQAIMQHLMFKALFELSANRSEFVSRLFSRAPLMPVSETASISQIWKAYMNSNPDHKLFDDNFAAILRQLITVRGVPLSTDDTISLRYVYGSFFRYGPDISYRPGGQSNTVATFATLTSTSDSAGVKRSFLASNDAFQFVKGMHMRNLIIPVVGDFGGTQALRMVGDYLREHNATVNAFYTSNVEQYLFRPTDLWRQFYRNIENMPLDSASLFIRPSLANLSSYVSFTSTPTTHNPLPPTAPSVVQDPAFGSIVGLVTDSTSGRNLATAAVTLLHTGFGATTDTAGRYSLPNVPPGKYTLSVRRIGYAVDTTTALVITAGSAIVQDLRLKPVPLTFSVVSRGSVSYVQSVRANSREAVQLCPILPFLAANAAGRINLYPDVQACVK